MLFISFFFFCEKLSPEFHKTKLSVLTKSTHCIGSTKIDYIAIFCRCRLPVIIINDRSTICFRIMLSVNRQAKQEMIVDMLYDIGIKAETIEGWCIYEDDSSCTDRCYDEHTWVECEEYYIDVTADQFNDCML